MSVPFTYEQAQEICEDFEDLIDTELVLRTPDPVKCVIDHVCIVPFSEADKRSFMEHYTASGDPQHALLQCSGDAFDVVIIARDVRDEDEIIIQSIEEYIAANGVRYNFP
jgi:hypothetical protein